MTLRSVMMDFEYQNMIENPPRSPQDLFTQACSSDGVTINSWSKIWLEQTKANHETHGPFHEHSIGKLFGKYALKPGIVVGSGPSLKENGAMLKETYGIPVVSCLHNFHYFVDNNLPCEAFVTLDAGLVCIEEISEGGIHNHQYYVDSTVNYTLVAFIGTHPDLLKLWKGEILFFNCPVPDKDYLDKSQAIEKFNVWMTSGGNVLGACAYLAKAIMGCNPIAFVGADYSFSYTKNFHGWSSKYDAKLGNALRANDVWGNKVYTWQSYYNFKLHADWMACTIPGIYVNCTEGGIMGAYPEGNIQQIKQMSLSYFLRMYSMHEELRKQCEDPTCGEQKILY